MTARIRRWSLRIGATIAVVAAIAYAAILVALYAQQERLIFPGRPLAVDFKYQFDQRFEEVHLPVPGATLDALHFMQDDPRGLFFSCMAMAATCRPGRRASTSTDV
jgi:hypothetical protein